MVLKRKTKKVKKKNHERFYSWIFFFQDESLLMVFLKKIKNMRPF